MTSSRFMGLSAVSHERSGNHYRSDPVRVQSTIRPLGEMPCARTHSSEVSGHVGRTSTNPAIFFVCLTFLWFIFVAKVLSRGVSRPPVTQVGVRLVKWLCPHYVLCATSMASPRQFWRPQRRPCVGGDVTVDNEAGIGSGWQQSRQNCPR